MGDGTGRHVADECLFGQTGRETRQTTPTVTAARATRGPSTRHATAAPTRCTDGPSGPDGSPQATRQPSTPRAAGLDPRSTSGTHLLPDRAAHAGLPRASEPTSARPEVWNCDAEWRIHRPPRRARGRVHGPPSTSEPVRVSEVGGVVDLVGTRASSARDSLVRSVDPPVLRLNLSSVGSDVDNRQSTISVSIRLLSYRTDLSDTQLLLRISSYTDRNRRMSDSVLNAWTERRIASGSAIDRTRTSCAANRSTDRSGASSSIAIRPDSNGRGDKSSDAGSSSLRRVVSDSIRVSTVSTPTDATLSSAVWSPTYGAADVVLTSKRRASGCGLSAGESLSTPR